MGHLAMFFLLDASFLMRDSTTRIISLVVVAGIGALAIAAPPWLLAQVSRLKDAGVSGFWIKTYWGIVIVGAALLAIAAGWMFVKLWGRTRKRKRRRKEDSRAPSDLSAEAKKSQIERNLHEANQLGQSDAVSPQVRLELENRIESVESKHEFQRLEIVVFGTISSGKSAVLNALAGREVFRTQLKGGTTVNRNEIPWPTNDRVILVDTPGLAEVDGGHHQQVAADAAKDADLVLLVVDGPIREYEFQLARQLLAMEKRLCVCLNKVDWYDEQQQAMLLDQLQEQLSKIGVSDDVVSIQAQIIKRRIVRKTAEGREQEEWTEVPADISALADRMLDVIASDGRELLLANLLLQSRALVEDAKRRVRTMLDTEAWRVVDRHMWAAGSAAALSPLPLIDIAVGSAITTKMVLAIARVYQRNIDLEAAVELLGQLGKNLLAILGVSAATPVVASGVASLLKTVPGAGTIAGGALQGFVQVLVTRWVGAVFVAYFGAEMEENSESLPDIARREWKRITQISELAKLVQATKNRFGDALANDFEESQNDD